MPIWVRMPNLPLEWWSVDSISRVASVIGLPLRVDLVTTNSDRLSFARCCVEVGFNDELPETVMLQDEAGEVRFIQKIIYEGNILKCSHCCIFGHATSHCSKHLELRPVVPTTCRVFQKKVWKPIGKRPSLDLEEVNLCHLKNGREKDDVQSSPLGNMVCHNPFGLLEDLGEELSVGLEVRSENAVQTAGKKGSMAAGMNLDQRARPLGVVSAGGYTFDNPEEISAGVNLIENQVLKLSSGHIFQGLGLTGCTSENPCDHITSIDKHTSNQILVQSQNLVRKANGKGLSVGCNISNPFIVLADIDEDNLPAGNVAEFGSASAQDNHNSKQNLAPVYKRAVLPGLSSVQVCSNEKSAQQCTVADEGHLDMASVSTSSIEHMFAESSLHKTRPADMELDQLATQPSVVAALPSNLESGSLSRGQSTLHMNLVGPVLGNDCKEKFGQQTQDSVPVEQQVQQVADPAQLQFVAVRHQNLAPPQFPLQQQSPMHTPVEEQQKGQEENGDEQRESLPSSQLKGRKKKKSEWEKMSDYEKMCCIDAEVEAWIDEKEKREKKDNNSESSDYSEWQTDHSSKSYLEESGEDSEEETEMNQNTGLTSRITRSKGKI